MTKLNMSKIKYLGVVVGIVVLGAGVVSSANTSLPGSLLYPVKLNVNEKVQAVFKTENIAKADFYIYLANKRLDELKIVKDTNKLNDEILKKVQSNFNQQTIEAQTKINMVDNTSMEKLRLQEAMDVLIDKAMVSFGLREDTTEADMIPESLDEQKPKVPAKK